MTGSQDQNEELRFPLRHFLVRAGDRALQLDVSKAVVLYRKALEHFATDDPDRPSVIAGLARATQSEGNLREASAFFEEAIDGLLACGDRLRAGAMLAIYSVLRWQQGKSQKEVASILDRAVQLLQQEPPSVELARAYVQLSFTATVRGDNLDGIKWADMALSLATEFESPTSMVAALDFRGGARVRAGDVKGIDDLRDSVRLGLERGVGLATADSFSNLACMTWEAEGPASALEMCNDAVAFARQRGIRETEMYAEAETCGVLFELGEWDELLPRADTVIRWSSKRDAVQTSSMALLSRAKVHIWRGQLEEEADLEELTCSLQG